MHKTHRDTVTEEQFFFFTPKMLTQSFTEEKTKQKWKNKKTNLLLKVVSA